MHCTFCNQLDDDKRRNTAAKNLSPLVLGELVRPKRNFLLKRYTHTHTHRKTLEPAIYDQLESLSDSCNGVYLKTYLMRNHMVLPPQDAVLIYIHILLDEVTKLAT